MWDPAKHPGGRISHHPKAEALVCFYSRNLSSSQFRHSLTLLILNLPLLFSLFLFLSLNLVAFAASYHCLSPSFALSLLSELVLPLFLLRTADSFCGSHTSTAQGEGSVCYHQCCAGKCLITGSLWEAGWGCGKP